MFDAEGFGDDEEAEFVGDGAQDLESFEAEALEAVGGGAGFEGTPAQDTAAGTVEGFGDSAGLLVAFDGAGAGHEDDVIAADVEVAADGDGEAGGSGRCFLEGGAVAGVLVGHEIAFILIKFQKVLNDFETCEDYNKESKKCEPFTCIDTRFIL